jgi:excisionase family DNA binding protein
MTTEEACAFLRCSRSTLHRRIRSGGLPYHRFAGGARSPLRFDPAELEAYLTRTTLEEVAA